MLITMIITNTCDFSQFEKLVWLRNIKKVDKSKGLSANNRVCRFHLLLNLWWLCFNPFFLEINLPSIFWIYFLVLLHRHLLIFFSSLFHVFLRLLFTREIMTEAIECFSRDHEDFSHLQSICEYNLYEEMIKILLPFDSHQIHIHWRLILSDPSVVSSNITL